jgi:hypothetical protein
MVTVGNVCRRRGFSTPIWPYHSLPRSVLTERTQLAVLVWSSAALPTPTVSHARVARRIGCFGLVGPPITIAYQSRDLAGDLPRVTFTNHYHRGEDITHSGLDYVLCGVITIVLMWR